MALRARGSSMASAAVPARESCHHQARAKARAAAKPRSTRGRGPDRATACTVQTRPEAMACRCASRSQVKNRNYRKQMKSVTKEMYYRRTQLLPQLLHLEEDHGLKANRAEGTEDHFQRSPAGTAGLPVQRRLAGRSSFTKEHAVTSASSPIETPGQTKTLA